MHWHIGEAKMAKHYTSIISSVFGKFAKMALPAPLQHFVNTSYVALMGLDMSEFKHPKEYKTLNALFTRSLEKERSFDGSEDVVISPADSLVTDLGTIKDGTAYQIKGMAYRLDELLGGDYRGLAQELEGGRYVNLYLSPKDYHRYHIPMDLTVKSLTHIPGKLYPVNMPLLKRKPNLFIENERVVIECADTYGRLHFLVLVGALNVGKMAVTFEDAIRTNSEANVSKHYTYNNLSCKKGELFGWFEMGSTILLFSQKDAVALGVSLGQKVRFGDQIAKLQIPPNQ